MPLRAATVFRLYLLTGLVALSGSAVWSASVYTRESKHAGEPLPQLTLAQLVTRAPRGYVHLQDATPDFGHMLVEDHLCHRIQCRDHFMPLIDTAHPKAQRVAVLSLVRTFPGDVNEARHPFDLHDPVIEGTIDTYGLFPSQIQDFRGYGLRVDDQTVVLERRALHGTVPPADSVDVLVPWFVGVPVALVTGLVGGVGLRRIRQTSDSSDRTAHS